MRVMTIMFLLVLYVTSVSAGDLTIINATLIPSPNARPMSNATITIHDGLIKRIAEGESAATGKIIDAEGLVVTAGLWNSHVHFTDPALVGNATQIIQDMLLKFGFTSVVDTGSYLPATIKLRKAIDAGHMYGPRIITANGSFVYTDGTPSYLPPNVQLPEVERAELAVPMVNAVLDSGADGIKIFSGSLKSSTKTILIPPDIVRALTDAAHARGTFVISHPANRAGLENAVYNGVDVLAHTTPPAGRLDSRLVKEMVDRNVGLIPTLKLWSWEGRRTRGTEPELSASQKAAVDQLAEFFEAGGQVLFGTDVGYIRDYDTTEEFEMMYQAGMKFANILASLTVNPATRFAKETGEVVVGGRGDLVIFAGDPRRDVRAFAQIMTTIRGGEVVFSRSK